MNRLIPTTAAALGLLAALGGPAVADTGGEEVATACEQATNVGEAICACIGAMAVQELSEDQRAWYIAALKQDFATTEQLNAEMPPTDLADVATFARTAPAGCAGQ